VNHVLTPSTPFWIYSAAWRAEVLVPNPVAAFPVEQLKLQSLIFHGRVDPDRNGNEAKGKHA
jgi:hypothetical protein